MSDGTLIEWTKVPGATRGATWNIMSGCSKVSPACKNCCAERDWRRLSQNPKVPKYFGRDFGDVQIHPDMLDQPLRWTAPRGILIALMSDMFHDQVPFEFLDKVFAVAALAKQHTFLGLTKRAERMHAYFTEVPPEALMARWSVAAADMGYLLRQEDISFPLANLWLGVTAEDQETADARIPHLLQTPAVVRFVSAEPLLGGLDLVPYMGGRTYSCSCGFKHTEAEMAFGGGENYFCAECGEQCAIHPSLDWVIAGGESGTKARPTVVHWLRALRDQCRATGTPFFFKQWGEWAHIGKEPADIQDAARCYGPTVRCYSTGDGETSVRIGKKAAGHLLDGREHREFPQCAA